MGCTESSLHPETDLSSRGHGKSNRRNKHRSGVVGSSSPFKSQEDKPVLLRLSKVEENIMQIIDEIYGQPAIQVSSPAKHHGTGDN